MLFWFLLACNAGDPCRTYVTALNRCTEETGVEPADIDPAIICQGYDDKDEGLVTYYECLTAAYEMDCSTEQGYAAATAAANACSVPATSAS